MTRGSLARNLPPLHQGELHMDPVTFSAAWRGRPLRLTPSLWIVLHLLARHPGHVKDPAAILTALGDEGNVYLSAARDVIKRLRPALGQYARGPGGYDTGPIETVVGVGWRWKETQ